MFIRSGLGVTALVALPLLVAQAQEFPKRDSQAFCQDAANKSDIIPEHGKAAFVLDCTRREDRASQALEKSWPTYSADQKKRCLIPDTSYLLVYGCFEGRFPPSSPTSHPQQWVEHRPAGAGYRIEFPSAPKLSSRNLQTPAGPTVLYEALFQEKDGSILIVTHTTVPSGPLTLEGAAQAALKKGQLLSRTNVKVSGQPALRLVTRDPSSRFVGVIVVVIRGRSLYQAMYASATGEETPQSRRFFASFALVP